MEVSNSACGWVTIDPAILGGTPCVTGTRIPAHKVKALLNLSTYDEIIRGYPTLAGKDLTAVGLWAERQPELGVTDEESQEIEENNYRIHRASRRRVR